MSNEEIITTEKGNITLCKHETELPIDHGIAEWDEDTGQYSSYFMYQGEKEWLGDYMSIDKHSPFFGKFDGYKSDSFFSGVVIKFDDDMETVSAWTYIS